MNRGASSSISLPVIRSHERMEYKRCQRKWFWHWRKGLVPKKKTFGALDLGTWFHSALAWWYVEGTKRRGHLQELLTAQANMAIRTAQSNNAPQHVLDEAEELALLGEAMAEAYARYYSRDYVDVIGAEIPLEFQIADDTDTVIALHRLKPDLVYRDKDKRIWLMEHKTAASIRTEHLVIDDQARPYGAMAELALRNAGVLGRKERVSGIMYNFIRKALPDIREQDREGRYLNKNGTVSKRQPPEYFRRHPVRMTDRAKLVTLRRLQREAIEITVVTQALREKRIKPESLKKTPHRSCPRFCEYFAMCNLEEEGADIRDMERGLFTRQDPYLYAEDSTDEVQTFEMG